ncbi:MAG: D-alanyl-D-alanine carboxypeptidase [Clostridia bacterium]|nr:D-alanyl-D-alanine carboxypeptidase [Clostridia bacterium]
MKRYISKFVVLSFIFCIIFENVLAYEEEFEEFNEDEIVLETVNVQTGEPKINSNIALVFDRKYKKILFEKRINEKVPNASTTKILTAIVAYENSNIDDIVMVSRKAAAVGGSRIGLHSGDKISMDNLMKGLLLSSGNDAAIAIAEHVGGDVSKFCQMMNERARKLGAENTNFVSPHGLDSDEHYTTASDLLIFSEYLLNIEYLKNIVNMRNSQIFINGNVKNIRTTNEILGLYPEANGIKTGFTNKAGRCLITSIEKNDRPIIIIVLGANTKKERTLDTISLINYAYNEFEEVDLFKDMNKTFEIKVDKAKADYYQFEILGQKMHLMKKEDLGEIRYDYKVKKNFESPLPKGTILGEVEIYIKERKEKTVKIFSDRPIERKGVKEYFEELVKEKLQDIEIR